MPPPKYAPDGAAAQNLVHKQKEGLYYLCHAANLIVVLHWFQKTSKWWHFGPQVR